LCIFGLAFTTACKTDRNATENVQQVLGAKSIEELIVAYKNAHIKNDFSALRAMCWWNAPDTDRPNWQTSIGNAAYETEIKTLFAFRLKEVVFRKYPEPDHVLGGAITYRITRENGMPQLSITSGPVSGKLILRLFDPNGSGKAIKEVDPALAVYLWRGRYFLYNDRTVTMLAAKSVKLGEPPQYSPVPPEESFPYTKKQ
jgi:hypothetical protein